MTVMIRKKSLDSLEYNFNPKYSIIGDYDLLYRLSFNWNFIYEQISSNFNNKLFIIKEGQNKYTKIKRSVLIWKIKRKEIENKMTVKKTTLFKI